MESATRKPGTHRQRSHCLRCNTDLELEERLLVGEVVQCAECQAQLEVVDLDPLVLGPLAPIEAQEEDFQDWD